MRYDKLTTDEVIDLLKQEGNTIYWTEEAYRRMPDGIDWDRVAEELGTEEIHTYNQGMKTVAYDVISREMSIPPEDFVHNWNVREFYHLVRFLSWESHGQNEYSKLMSLKATHSK